MTDDEWSKIGKRLKLRSLSIAVERYLREISHGAADSTFSSHQSSLSRFRDWVLKTFEFDVLLTDCITQYSRYLLEKEGLSVPTIQGNLCSIVNLLAYHLNEDPAIVNCYAAISLREHSLPSLQSLGNRIISDFAAEPESESGSRIPNFVTALRHRQFGTRKHVYVELLLDTKSRPEQVRQIDLDDLDIGSGRVVVGIPETHLVSSVGLVTDRISPLSTTTRDALTTYVEFERRDSHSGERKPLFTTHEGRASSTTLRRSIKQASQTVPPESLNETRPVLPDEIWRYAMLNVSTGQ